MRIVVCRQMRLHNLFRVGSVGAIGSVMLDPRTKPSDPYEGRGRAIVPDNLRFVQTTISGPTHAEVT